MPVYFAELTVRPVLTCSVLPGAEAEQLISSYRWRLNREFDFTVIVHMSRTEAV